MHKNPWRMAGAFRSVLGARLVVLDAVRRVGGHRPVNMIPAEVRRDVFTARQATPKAGAEERLLFGPVLRVGMSPIG